MGQVLWDITFSFLIPFLNLILEFTKYPFFLNKKHILDRLEHNLVTQNNLSGQMLISLIVFFNVFLVVLQITGLHSITDGYY